MNNRLDRAVDPDRDHTLGNAGAEITLVTAYRSEAPRYSRKVLDDLFAEGLPDLLSFASGASAENLVKILQGTPYLPALKKIPSIAIGPVTSVAARSTGWKVAAVSPQATLEALAQLLKKYLLRG